MKKSSVLVGGVYQKNVSGHSTRVRIISESPYGGWVGINLTTGRQVRVRSAMSLHPVSQAAEQLSLFAEDASEGDPATIALKTKKAAKEAFIDGRRIFFGRLHGYRSVKWIDGQGPCLLGGLGDNLSLPVSAEEALREIEQAQCKLLVLAEDLGTPAPKTPAAQTKVTIQPQATCDLTPRQKAAHKAWATRRANASR